MMGREVVGFGALLPTLPALHIQAAAAARPLDRCRDDRRGRVVPPGLAAPVPGVPCAPLWPPAGSHLFQSLDSPKHWGGDSSPLLFRCTLTTATSPCSQWFLGAVEFRGSQHHISHRDLPGPTLGSRQRLLSGTSKWVPRRCTAWTTSWSVELQAIKDYQYASKCRATVGLQGVAGGGSDEAAPS